MRRGSAYDGDLVIYVSGDAARALKAGDSVELTDTLGNRLAYGVDGWETVDAASADALGGGAGRGRSRWRHRAKVTFFSPRDAP